MSQTTNLITNLNKDITKCSINSIHVVKGLEAELTMSKNVILRKMCFKVSITAKKSEILTHNVTLCRYVLSPI